MLNIWIIGHFTSRITITQKAEKVKPFINWLDLLLIAIP